MLSNYLPVIAMLFSKIFHRSKGMIQLQIIISLSTFTKRFFLLNTAFNKFKRGKEVHKLIKFDNGKLGKSIIFPCEKVV